MTILYLSDFDLKGSGYANIAFSLCTHLAKNGYEVQALGLGYNGEEHHFPFRIAPLSDLRMVVPIVRDLQRQGVDIETLIVALDIPLQEALLQSFNAPCDLPYIGLFPLEAPPLCQSWALTLLRMDERLIMSHFGLEACEASGVKATYIPIGVDCESWNPPTDEERLQLRKGLGIEPDTFVVLTVADNQERKNLSRSMEIFADALKSKDAKYLMVTRPNSPVGWKIQDYALQLGIFNQMSVWDRGMPFKQLWSLFAVADCFLLTSKAEGLAMPVLEAMAMRLPVVGTRCTAIEEHLQDGRGYLIKPDYAITDPFGNGLRYFAGREDGKFAALIVSTDRNDPDDKSESELMLDRAQAYVQARKWSEAGQVLIEAIERAKAVRVQKVELPIPVMEPA